MHASRSWRVTLQAVFLFVFAGISARADDSEIRIGAVLPVTGKESKIGGAYKAATELAVKEVNDAGGLDVHGKKMKIDLRLLDDTSDAAKSAQLVEQLMVQQKVHAVIGGYGSQLVQAQSVVPERYGIPFISGGAGASSIYGRSKWVFGTLSPVENLAGTQMEFLSDLVKQGKLKAPLKISLLRENTEHGKDFQKGVQDFVKAHPEAVLDRPRRELRALRARLQAALDARPGREGRPLHVRRAPRGLHRDAADLHADGSLPSDGHVRRARRRRSGPQGARRRDRLHLRERLVVGPPAVSAGQGVQREVEGGHRQRSAVVPRDRLRDRARALRRDSKAGSLKPEAIRAALAGLELKDSILPGGVLKFSKTGEATLPFVVTQNKPEGKLDLVWPKSAKTGDPVAPDSADGGRLGPSDQLPALGVAF